MRLPRIFTLLRSASDCEAMMLAGSVNALVHYNVLGSFRDGFRTFRKRQSEREREKEVSSGFPAHSAVAWWGWTDDELLYRNTHCFHGWRDRERLQMSTFRNFMDGEFYGVGFRLVTLWLLGVVCWGWLNTILENIFLIGSRLDGENLIVYEVELWIFFY